MRLSVMRVLTPPRGEDRTPEPFWALSEGPSPSFCENESGLGSGHNLRTCAQVVGSEHIMKLCRNLRIFRRACEPLRGD